MNKAEFTRWMKEMYADMRKGYYGQTEFIDELWDKFSEIERAYGGCRKCYGKGYATYRHGISGAEDLEMGVKGFTEAPKTNIIYCTCDRGKQLKQLLTQKNR